MGSMRKRPILGHEADGFFAGRPRNIRTFRVNHRPVHIHPAWLSFRGGGHRKGRGGETTTAPADHRSRRLTLGR